jgi:hypothetical protein
MTKSAFSIFSKMAKSLHFIYNTAVRKQTNVRAYHKEIQLAKSAKIISKDDFQICLPGQFENRLLAANYCTVSILP